ncbi:MAG: AMP-dependent synthetase, partial [Gammaproteobacteria bacterium]
LALVVLAAGHGLSDAEVGSQLRALLESVNAQLESHETLDHILVCGEPWTIENDLLTPTLKLRRDRIEARYHERIEQLDTPDIVVWLGTT